MAPPPTLVSGMERGIHSLDSARLLIVADRLCDQLKSGGVDLQAPCSDVHEKTKCWLRLHLAHCERNPLESLHAASGTCTRSFTDGVILLYTLLEHHVCIKRLVLNTMAFPLWHFPSLLGNALRANRGIVEVEEHPVDMAKSWREMRQCRALSCALGNLSPRLSCLHVSSLKLDHVAAECIASGIAKSDLRRVRLCNEMSASMTRKLMSAVNSCQSLTSLEFAGFRQFSRSSAIALASALKCNKTLQKLRVRFMADDVLGIILASLKHNEALQELSLDYSVDLSRSSLWDGLQALRENRVLKRLELTEACFSSSCGIKRFLEIAQLSACAWDTSTFLKTGTPTLPLRDVCARLQVSWNTPVLEQWAACQVFRFSKARLAWTVDSNCSGIVQWFAAARVNSASLVELVIECPCRVDAESTEAVVSFLETTHSLKKVIMRPFQYNYVFSAAILNSLARNKSVREAEFDQTLRAHLDVKALEALLVANRTLHRLKFRYDSLPCSAPVMLARALKDNFVFLTLEFEDQNAQNDMYPVLKVLNRNRSLLNRAVECVLDSARDEHSQGALRLLCDTDSLLDAVAVASGKVRDECRCLVLEAVRSLELQHSEDTLSTEKMNVCDRTQCN
ncbi:hypothetical protein MTO96_033364 [Rhipicephalus appendiculatus]